MTQIKIYGTTGVLEPRRARLSDVLHGCVVEAFDYPEDKRAHRFFALAPEDFYAPAGRSADYTILEVNLFTGRSVDAKKRLYALIFERFERELGIAPVDVEITLVETPRHDWAMRGLPGDEVGIDYRVDV
ncbi:MAG: tautomerase family protein [Solirubrobacteraceae bacterium]